MTVELKEIQREIDLPLLNFSEVKDILKRNELHLLGRNSEKRKQYQESCQHIQSKWVTMTDYILHSKFGCLTELDPISGKLKSSHGASKQTVLCPNDFQYNFQNDVHHYIYWKLFGTTTKTTDLLIEEANQIAIDFMKENPNFKEFVIYMNPPYLQSIPELQHVHILFYEPSSPPPPPTITKERIIDFPLLKWLVVKSIIAQNDLHLLGRSAEQHQSYQLFSQDVKSKWRSITDYILFTKFDFLTEVDSVSGKLKSIRSSSPSSSSSSSSSSTSSTSSSSSYEVDGIKTSLSKNDFPYNFERGIHHYIYWKLGTTTVLSIEEVNEIAMSMMKENVAFKDFAVYINPPHLKSIPELEHAHILFFEP